ncbi:hypothetical protein [Natrinema sp. 1APR25-10V2]|uniref:hypothetical protein n=1 Tax=Natrinema sp. 1APR25-10V2 TaxID=2951081 RepID=UPI002876386D|nr:hypothetical protein [Natrinema sp. 1APR25-10V2]MDS0477691.1 hypothetical protein [Natrinema sp. 1APR25-10V2]
MRRLAVGLFLVLHGLVHGWYVVLSQGWVEVEDQMGWSGHSLLLSPILPEGAILTVASVLYVAVTVGFVLGGIGYAFDLGWWEPVVVGAAVLSTAVLVAMWNGQFDLLIEQGAAGVLINIGLLVSILVLEFE